MAIQLAKNANKSKVNVNSAELSVEIPDID